MARKNRLVVEDGLYHLTTRIAHQEYLLAKPEIKRRIVGWIYDIADFSGINVCAWNIMDNHLHLYVHVPTVPEKYWLASPETGTVPDANRLEDGRPIPPKAIPVPSAFSMRPSENRAPRWLPDDPSISISPAGDSPSLDAIRRAIADGVPVVTMPQVPTRFRLTDEEMLVRLGYLYSDNPRRVADIAKRWEYARSCGAHDSVERAKNSYCRRMYNVSQYMKTLKQRISEYFNRKLGHEGQLWDGRFYSALVDKNDEKAKLCVLSYIELNSYRTKNKIKPHDWNWCSFHMASASVLDNEGWERYVQKARGGYERLFGTDWEDVVKRLESVFEAKVSKEEQEGACRRTMIGIVHSHCRMLERGGFISRNIAFAEKTLAALPSKFPSASKDSINFFMDIDWSRAA